MDLYKTELEKYLFEFDGKRKKPKREYLFAVGMAIGATLAGLLGLLIRRKK